MTMARFTLSQCGEIGFDIIRDLVETFYDCSIRHFTVAFWLGCILLPHLQSVKNKTSGIVLCTMDCATKHAS